MPTLLRTVKLRLQHHMIKTLPASVACPAIRDYHHSGAWHSFPQPPWFTASNMKLHDPQFNMPACGQQLMRQ